MSGQRGSELRRLDFAVTVRMTGALGDCVTRAAARRNVPVARWIRVIVANVLDFREESRPIRRPRSARRPSPTELTCTLVDVTNRVTDIYFELERIESELRHGENIGYAGSLARKVMTMTQEITGSLSEIINKSISA